MPWMNSHYVSDDQLLHIIERLLVALKRGPAKTHDDHAAIVEAQEMLDARNN